ncbi:MAG: L,D-transpeptidase [Salinivirgaceae bacterium]
MSKPKWRIIIYGSSSLLIVLLSIWVITRIQNPPLPDLITARKAITKAKKINAEVYAKSDFQKAEDFYRSAMRMWRRENLKFILNRDYSEVIKSAGKSKTHATKAYNSSLVDKRNLKDKLAMQIAELKEAVKKNQPLFNKLPVPTEIVKQNSQGQLMLFEAESTFNRGKYKDLEGKLVFAEKNIQNSYHFANQLLIDYFAMYPRWVKQAEQTRIQSKKNNSYAIVIDKFSRTCFVYNKGELKNIFDVELGKNWIGGKLYSGDQATPEGQYFIVSKKDSRKTKYYKALLLDYPNEDDKARFKNGKDNGTLQLSSKIGNLIEIHGDGGKGLDWTNGCIALQNKDIDTLFKIVEENTPVTIVGSLKPLKEILND